MSKLVRPCIPKVHKLKYSIWVKNKFRCFSLNPSKASMWSCQQLVHGTHWAEATENTQADLPPL